jgi:hypothetical protein
VNIPRTALGEKTDLRVSGTCTYTKHPQVRSMVTSGLYPKKLSAGVSCLSVLGPILSTVQAISKASFQTVGLAAAKARIVRARSLRVRLARSATPFC